MRPRRRTKERDRVRNRNRKIQKLLFLFPLLFFGKKSMNLANCVRVRELEINLANQKTK